MDGQRFRVAVGPEPRREPRLHGPEPRRLDEDDELAFAHVVAQERSGIPGAACTDGGTESVRTATRRIRSSLWSPAISPTRAPARALHSTLVLVAMVGLVVGAIARAGRADPPVASPRDQTLRGVVRDRQGRGIAGVSLTVRFPVEHYAVAVTDDDGQFLVSGLPSGSVTVEAYLSGAPHDKPGYDLVTTAMSGSDSITLTIDRGAELLVACSTGLLPSDTHHSPAQLVLQTRSGPRECYAAIDHGKAAFRRIPIGVPWTLWFPWSETTKGTYYESGLKLESGERTVTLEPGKAIRGHVKVDPDRKPALRSSVRWERALAQRGPITAEGTIDRAGNVEFPLLASGTWRVMVYVDGKDGDRATTDVEAGGPPFELVPTSLDPKAPPPK
jgi:hypothetical protein